MMGLYFLVLFAVGILRPIRNALALDGLAESEFYKVYLVSAVVILFAPAFNYLADRIQWRTLIPATAAFFALNLLVFRAIYSEGSATLGMVFYGWYDLFAAALVTQFFMAVQIFFNARDAKSAIPLVIAAGSLGATRSRHPVGGRTSQPSRARVEMWSCSATVPWGRVIFTLRRYICAMSRLTPEW